ncbi:MAG: hypothetical protein IT436_12780 [Phycisphaerales bacterium]|nr:hypothetical protein [Phycisphaerales bacterium]
MVVRRRSIARGLAVPLLAAGLAVVGCAGRARTDAEPARSARTLEPEIAASERGIANGLELVWWVVDDEDGVLGRTLAGRSEDLPGLDPGAAERWRAAGLRIVAVPLSQMAGLTGDLPLIGRVQREWMGQLPRWTVAVRGSMAESMTIAMVDGPLTLGAGRLRMLVRCWLNPAPADGQVRAALRIELMPQHEERADETLAYQSALGINDRKGIEAEGLVFTRLMAGLEAQEGYAYLIVPESPEVEWKSERPEGGDRETLPLAPRASDLPVPFDEPPDEEPRADEGRARPELPVKPRSIGPSAFKLRTLGEAMLTDAPSGGQARAKVVMALIPRVPTEFRLLEK